ncbi:MAG: energy transducer TonB [Deltaproteobacteria bacterium]|nr:energy transducer TonB [Deltaproteobacteria bacterium]
MSANNPWVLSALVHSAIVITFLLGYLIDGGLGRPKRIHFQILEAPKAVSSTPYAVTKPKAEVKKKKEVHAVFGLSREAITGDLMDSMPEKLGNTVAKENDSEKLKDDDPSHLPNPAEEFLVTEMPSLISEVRISYPPEARAKGIQGAVVMDILIDQSGAVRDAKLIEGPGFGLNEAALSAVMGFRFQPAHVGDSPVAVRIRYAYRFVLER